MYFCWSRLKWGGFKDLFINKRWDMGRRDSLLHFKRRWQVTKLYIYKGEVISLYFFFTIFYFILIFYSCRFNCFIKLLLKKRTCLISLNCCLLLQTGIYNRWQEGSVMNAGCKIHFKILFLLLSLLLWGRSFQGN